MTTRLARLAIAAVFVAACAATPDGAPTGDELDDLDQWSQTADGKADLPGTWAETVTWLRDFYTNRMSAIWHHQEHPTSAAGALARIRQIVTARGLDPNVLRFATSVRRLHTELLDHSEVDIALPGGGAVRLVGDPKGAGAFLDAALFEAPVGPPLCLTWTELATAVDASYLGGAYGADFVCHTVTEHVLRALGVGSSVFANQVRTYPAARWIWGPIVPSGNPQDPAAWPESRACP